MFEAATQDLRNATYGDSEEDDGFEGLSNDGEWVRRTEAATRLGVTERTIENRIGSGKLSKRVRKDGTVEVLVPKKAGDEQAGKALVLLERFNGALATQVGPLIGELARSRDIIREQAEELGRLKAKVEELEKGREQAAKPWWRFW